MKSLIRTILALQFALCAADAFAAMSKEPVIITNCRSFAVRGDPESKTGLATRFVGSVETDCDDINKVSSNKIISVSGTMTGRNGVFSLRAFYPDGHSYDHYVMFKASPNPARDTELWLATSPDFARSTYAVAQTDTDKTRSMEMFADSQVAPSVVPAILYSFGQDYFLSDEGAEARRNYDLGLIKIYESIMGGSEGLTSDFVKSDDWLDSEKRGEALKTLRDYTIANIGNINLDNSLDPDGKLFADHMKIYSDEFVKMAQKEKEFESTKIIFEKTFALDDSAYQRAKEAATKCENVEKSVRKLVASCTTSGCILTNETVPASNSECVVKTNPECEDKPCEVENAKPQPRLKKVPRNRSMFVR